MLERGRSEDAAEALRRGEQVHREMEIAMGKQPTLAELLKKYEGAHPFRWFERARGLVYRLTGEAWQPEVGSPPPWVPAPLADAWFAELSALAGSASEATEPAPGGPKDDLKDTRPEAEIEPIQEPTLRELLEPLKAEVPGFQRHPGFRWLEGSRSLVYLHTGEAWYPSREAPPSWVPYSIWRAWHREADKKVLLARLEGSSEPAFDEPRDDLKDTNPKTAIGDTKVPLALCSPIASAHWALAQYVGMRKYQAWNWRVAGVRGSTYISAIKRHLDAYVSGEELDPADGSHHLGNIMACAAILLDAQAAGKLNDDRPPSVECRSTYEFIEKQMAVTRERYSHIEQRPYTIKDSTDAGRAAIS